MARGDQLYRQWSILQQLSEGRKSRRELAELLEVSLKTVTRDLESLAIFPIFEEREGIDVFYSLVRGARTPSVRFEEPELAALMLGKRTLQAAVTGTPYAAAVGDALAKVEALQRERARRVSLPDVFQSSFDQPRVDEPLRARLLEAALARRVIAFEYYTVERDAVSDRVVEPFFLYLHPRGLQLIAYCRTRAALLSFHVSCVRALRVLEERFDPEARAFDLEEFLATTFDGQRGLPVLDVRLRVREPSARWARAHFYHQTQEIEDVAGGVEIRFRAGAPQAIAARVLSLGPDCEVLAPPELRRLVAEQARAIWRLYEDDPNPGPDLSGGSGSV